MSAADPFALARDSSDDAILTLFREWRDALERLTARCLPDGEEFSRAHDATVETMRQIFDTEATGPIGLSIKAFVLAYEVQIDGPSSDSNPCALGRFCEEDYGAENTLYLNNHALRGLMIDAARIVPELAPLAAALIAAPVVMPPDDDDDVELIRAEQNMRQLLDEVRDMDDGEPAYRQQWDTILKCQNLIGSTEPTTLAGCAAKLRFLTHHEVGLEAGSSEDQMPSLRQVLAFIESAARMGGAA
jgi:hypothetical protein